MTSNQFQVFVVLGIITMVTGVLLMNKCMTKSPLIYHAYQKSDVSLPVHKKESYVVKRDSRSDFPNLAITACGNRTEEALTLIKSAVLFTNTFLFVHLVVDSIPLQRKFEVELDSWPADVRKRMEYMIYQAAFPGEMKYKHCGKGSWRTVFKPCASQRLFLGDLFRDLDSVIYVDVDTLFLAPIEDLWSIIYTFNSTQFLGVAPDSDLADVGFYTNRDIPIYGINAINSGVLLMNLTRLRTSQWLQKMTDTLIKKYKNELILIDNDLINIFLHDNPEFGYMLTCDWNYHTWQCIKCDQANKTGAALIHATMSAFHNDNTPPFKAVYLALKQFKLGIHSVKHDLLPSIRRHLDAVKETEPTFKVDCQKNTSMYTMRIETMIRQGGRPNVGAVNEQLCC